MSESTNGPLQIGQSPQIGAGKSAGETGRARHEAGSANRGAFASDLKQAVEKQKQARPDEVRSRDDRQTAREATAGADQADKSAQGSTVASGNTTDTPTGTGSESVTTAEAANGAADGTTSRIMETTGSTDKPAQNAATDSAVVAADTVSGKDAAVDISKAQGTNPRLDATALSADGTPLFQDSSPQSEVDNSVPAAGESLPGEALATTHDTAGTGLQSATASAAASATASATASAAVPITGHVPSDSAEVEGELASIAGMGNARARAVVVEGRSGNAAVDNQAVLVAASNRPSDDAAAVDSSPAQAPTAQVLKLDEVMTQSALASRYRQISGDSDSAGPTPRQSSDAVAASLSTGSVDTLAAAGSRMPGNGRESGMPAGIPLTDAELLLAAQGKEEAPVMRSADLLKELQVQRNALMETSMPAGNASTSDALLRSQSTDNMFTAMSGGIVTAPVLQRTDAAMPNAVQAPFAVPLLADDADAALNANIKWMSKEGVQNATVTVSPAGMGPISIKVGIEQDQMSVSILASQQTTREALESMLPRLREQLAGQGHESVKVDVSDGRGEQSRNGNGQMSAGSHNPSESWAQGSENNSGDSGRQTENEASKGTAATAELQVAEDLQQLALRGGDGQRRSPAFDAYV